MRKVLTVALLVALCFAASAHAVTLVTATGKPVGGAWQRWADRARVPTIPTQLVFYAGDATMCSGPLACSEGAPWKPTGSTWTAVGHGSVQSLTRWMEMFELGHQFDWRMLTWRERAYLASHWTISRSGYVNASGQTVLPQPVRRWPWENSRRAVDRGGEDGLEWAFATIYADCAIGENDQEASLTPFEPAGVIGPTVIPHIDTCGYLVRGVRQGRLSQHGR